MSQSTSNEWQQLFSSARAGENSHLLSLYLARRQGLPWLILPAARRLAARSLVLYPAQTSKARWAKRLLQMALRSGLRPALEPITLAIADDEPFASFLRQTARLPAHCALNFAILAGNPRAPGRRFVILVFDAHQRPALVVKAGVHAEAHQLLEAEENFLRAAPRTLPGVPELRATYADRGVRALALDFIGGESPTGDSVTHLSQILGSWLVEDRWVALRELGAWQRLLATAGTPPWPEGLTNVEGHQLHPAISHGDFAPWNIKSSGDRWVVLDWERGELAGIPGWDWFHFEMQPALLVRRENARALLRRFEALLDSPAFLTYAARAGWTPNPRPLALAYLEYCLRVNRQTEGQAALTELRKLATERWLGRAH